MLKRSVTDIIRIVTDLCLYFLLLCCANCWLLKTIFEKSAVRWTVIEIWIKIGLFEWTEARAWPIKHWAWPDTY